MSIVEQALEFEKRKLTLRSKDERIHASKEAKTLILDLNEIYKQNKDQSIMDLMKRLTAIKRKIESRLKMRVVV